MVEASDTDGVLIGLVFDSLHLYCHDIEHEWFQWIEMGLIVSIFTPSLLISLLSGRAPRQMPPKGDL